MAIVKMKHLRLVAMGSDREGLLNLLQSMGCVEIDEPSVDFADPVWASLTRPDSGGLNAARERNSEAERAVAVLKRSAPEKSRMLQAKPDLTHLDRKKLLICINGHIHSCLSTRFNLRNLIECKTII